MNHVQSRVKEIISQSFLKYIENAVEQPKDFAIEYGLDKPSHVIIEKRPEGLLIKKLKI